MTLNVNVSTPTSFELHLGRIPTATTEETRDVVLQLFGSVIPSIDVTGIDVPWMGTRARRDSSGGYDFQDWMVNFFVNSDFSNWKTLYDWIMYVAEENPLPSAHNITAILYIKDNFGKIVLKIVFLMVWIRNLGEVTLNTQSSEEFLQCSASFEYARYDVYLPNEAMIG